MKYECWFDLYDEKWQIESDEVDYKSSTLILPYVPQVGMRLGCEYEDGWKGHPHLDYKIHSVVMRDTEVDGKYCFWIVAYASDESRRKWEHLMRCSGTSQISI